MLSKKCANTHKKFPRTVVEEVPIVTRDDSSKIHDIPTKIFDNKNATRKVPCKVFFVWLTIISQPSILGLV